MPPVGGTKAKEEEEEAQEATAPVMEDAEEATTAPPAPPPLSKEESTEVSNRAEEANNIDASNDTEEAVTAKPSTKVEDADITHVNSKAEEAERVNAKVKEVTKALAEKENGNPSTERAPPRKDKLKKPQDMTTVVTRNGKTWNEMFDTLVEYKKVKGDCYVPDRYKTEDDVCLGLWVRNQRRRKDSLTEEQQKQLTDLGLDWHTQNERFEETWHERFARLTEYRIQHGDCKVPYTYKDDPALAKWVSQQRAQQAQGRLASDRKAKLDSIDFSWKINTVQNRNTKTEDTKWQRQFEKLKAFKAEHGHCKVPDRYAKDKPLGTWVKKQRLAYACDQLKEDRKNLLDAEGFVWRITDKTDGEKWNSMFQKLKDYKEKHGTTHVSRTVDDNDLKPLARWVKTQRALYKSDKILPDRKEALGSIGFVWDGTQVPVKRKRKKAEDDGEPKSKKARTSKKANESKDVDVKQEEDENTEDELEEGDTKEATTKKPTKDVTVPVFKKTLPMKGRLTRAAKAPAPKEGESSATTVKMVRAKEDAKSDEKEEAPTFPAKAETPTRERRATGTRVPAAATAKPEEEDAKDDEKEELPAPPAKAETPTRERRVTRTRMAAETMAKPEETNARSTRATRSRPK